MPQQPPTIVKAVLSVVPGGPSVTVHFNPASLMYSVENSVPKQSGGATTVQYVAQFSAKLTMDLLFDTTDTGVRCPQRVQPGSALYAGARAGTPSAAGE